MRRGHRRAEAQRRAAADLGVPVSEVLSVALFSGDGVVYQDGVYGMDGGGGGDAA